MSKFKYTLNENKDAEAKILSTENPSFKLDFKVYGKNLFQNLILTVNAYAIDDKEQNTPLPIKCFWKRVNNDTQIYIQENSSNSYIPTAEDIGYIIEVEVIGLEYKDKSKAIAQYGPIYLADDVKNSLELILAQGEAKFSCYLFSLEDQSKIADKQIDIVLNYQEIKLLDVRQNGSVEIESVRYNNYNPLIKLHSLDSTRFNLKFFESKFPEINDKSNKDVLSTKVKSEYNLIAMSKNQRELFYLLFQCFLVDEKIKNKKLFSYLNFKILPEEMKNGVMDLITEIKTLKEDNTILLHNSKFYQVENKNLKRELKELEEDFHLTMEQLNNPNLQIEVEKDYSLRNQVSNTPKDNCNNQNLNYYDLKNKYESLKANYSSVVSKEKALREENQNFQMNFDLFKSKYEALISENKDLRSDIDLKNQEINSISKSNTFLTDLNNKISSENKELREKNSELTKENEQQKKKLSDNSNNNESELVKLKLKNQELLTNLENLEYEVKTLKVQNNMFKSQKELLSKEITSTSKDKESLQKLHDDDKLVIKDQAQTIIEKSEEVKNLKSEINSLNEKYNQLNQKYALLEIEKQNYANTNNYNYDGNQNYKFNNTSMLDESVYKIGREDYEDYDNYKKEKDEIECQLLFLKSNNEAQKLEIDILKSEINSLKEKLNRYNTEVK